MNSLEKQSLSNRNETSQTFLISFENKLHSLTDIAGVEVLMVKLKYLGLHFDPFQQEVSSECQQVIQSLGLEGHLSDPYLATNILLRLLDKTEEHLNQLKQ